MKKILLTFTFSLLILRVYADITANGLNGIQTRTAIGESGYSMVVTNAVSLGMLTAEKYNRNLFTVRFYNPTGALVFQQSFIATADTLGTFLGSNYGYFNPRNVFDVTAIGDSLFCMVYSDNDTSVSEYQLRCRTYNLTHTGQILYLSDNDISIGGYNPAYEFLSMVRLANDGNNLYIAKSFGHFDTIYVQRTDPFQTANQLFKPYVVASPYNIYSNIACDMSGNVIVTYQKYTNTSQQIGAVHMLTFGNPINMTGVTDTHISDDLYIPSFHSIDVNNSLEGIIAFRKIDVLPSPDSLFVCYRRFDFSSTLSLGQVKRVAEMRQPTQNFIEHFTSNEVAFNDSRFYVIFSHSNSLWSNGLSGAYSAGVYTASYNKFTEQIENFIALDDPIVGNSTFSFSDISVNSCGMYQNAWITINSGGLFDAYDSLQPGVSFKLVPDTIIKCGPQPVTLTSTLSPVITGYTFEWLVPPGAVQVSGAGMPTGTFIAFQTSTIGLVTGFCGFYDTAYAYIRVDSSGFTVDAGIDQLYCFDPSEEVELEGVAPLVTGTYQWTANTPHAVSGLNPANQAQNNITVYPTATTIYYFTFTLSSGCAFTDSVTVTVVQPPAFSAGPDTLICFMDSLLLSGTVPGGYPFYWASSPADPNLSPALLVQAFIPSSPGMNTFTLFLEDTINGCLFKDEKRVAVQRPAISMPGDTMVCKGSQLHINASGNGIVNWTSVPYDPSLSGQTGGFPITVSPFLTTVYTIVATDTLGCVARDSIKVTVSNPAPPVINATFASACQKFQFGGDLGDEPIGPLDTCMVACELATVRYYSNFEPGATYAWAVTGATATSQSGDTLVVTWGAQGGGEILLTMTDSLGCVSQRVQCIKIAPAPTAAFSTLSPVLSGTIQGCLGSPITFTDLSTGTAGTPVETWEWDFGDGTTTTGAGSQVHAYANPGGYAVTLKVTNVCGCSHTLTRYIEIQSEEGPDIENCKPVVCPGTPVTYTTTASCGNYGWSAIGGTITSGPPYGNTVTVKWGDGQAGPGKLTLNVDPCLGYCTIPTTVEAPIVATVTEIEGASPACVGEQVRYSVPAWPGTVYTWNITNGTIQYGQDTHEVYALWDSAAVTGNVSVVWDNAFLGCGGSAAKSIEMKGRFYLEGPDESCANGSSQFATIPTASMQWQVRNPSGTVIHSSGGTTLNYNWPGAGVYTVRSTPSSPTQFCTPLRNLAVNVQPGAPGYPGTLNGPTEICPGKTYTYEALGQSANVYLQWAVTGGLPATGTGNQMTIKWGNTGPYNIKIRQVRDDGSGCRSTDTIFAIYRKDSLFSAAVTGPDTVCANSFANYSLSGVAEDYEWEIIPSNLGSISTGQGAQGVQVVWNNVAGTSPVNATLRVRPVICGVPLAWVTRALAITPQPVPPVYADTVACAGVPVTFQAGGNGTLYSWDFGMGGAPVVSSYDTVAYTFHAAGSYQVILSVANPYGCNTTLQAVHTIHIRPAPFPYIFTTDPLRYCLYDSVQTYLSTYSQSSGTGYQWYFNGSPVSGATASGYLAQQAGGYSVLMSNSFGCTRLSSPVLIVQNTAACDPDSSYQLAGCFPVLDSLGFPVAECCEYAVFVNGTATGDTISTCDSTYVDPVMAACASLGYAPRFNTVMLPGCGGFEFQAVLPATGQVTWNFGAPQDSVYSLYNGSTSVTYRYDKAGSYRVRMIYTVPTPGFPLSSCTFRFDTVVTVPLVADFIYDFACDSSNAHLVTLIDQSTCFGDPIVYFGWYDPQYNIIAEVNDSIAPPQYVYLDPGSHPVEYVVHNGAHICYVHDTIVLPDYPAAAFGLPNLACEGVPAHFTDQSAPQTNIIRWFWDFGDSAQLVMKDGIRTYDDPTDYFVSLLVTDKYGCVDVDTQLLTVNENDIQGNITFSTPTEFCKGDSIVLGVNPFIGTDPGPFSFAWSNGATSPTIKVSTTGDYYVILESQSTGCIERFEEVEIIAHSVPYPGISGADSYCVGDTIRLSGDRGPTYVYTWRLNGDSIANTPAIRFPADTAGVYPFSLVLTDTLTGCAGTASAAFTVTVHGLPPVPNITPSQPACEGPPVNLTASGSGNIFYWNTGATGPQVTVSHANVYKVTMQDSNGCKASNTYSLYPLPDFGAFLYGCYAFCEDDLPDHIPGVPGNTYNSYTWLFNGSPAGSGSVSVAPHSTSDGTGAYRLILTTGTGCTDTSEILDLTVLECADCDDVQVESYQVVCYNLESGPSYYVEMLVHNNGPEGAFTATVNGIAVTGFNTNALLNGGNVLQFFMDDPLLIEALLASGGCIEFTLTANPEAGSGVCRFELCLELPDCSEMPECDPVRFRFEDAWCSGYDAGGSPVYTVSGSVTGGGSDIRVVKVEVITGNTENIYSPAGGYAELGFTLDEGTPDPFCLKLYVLDPDIPEICTVEHCMTLAELQEYVEVNGGCPETRAARIQAKTPAPAIPGFRAWPNPARGTVTLEWDFGDGMDKESEANPVLEIFDVYGRPVATLELEGRNGRKEYGLDRLPAGVYHLAVSGKDAVLQRLQLIVAP